MKRVGVHSKMEKISVGENQYEVLHNQLGNLPLIVIKAKNGYVACGYIDKNAANKVGDVAAFVSGVKNVDDFVKAKIRGVTTWAEDFGVREGMSVKKALELMDLESKKEG